MRRPTHEGQKPRRLQLKASRTSFSPRREFGQRRLATYVVRCATFEQRYGMSTETFLEQFEAGTLGDQAEWFDWYAAAQGKEIWSRKHANLAHLK